MILRPMEGISKQSWYMIPIPDTVIYRFNLLGNYLQELLVFTDYKGQIIGDGDIELTGADGYGVES